MTRMLMPGRLLGFDQWGQNGLRRHANLQDRKPQSSDATRLSPGWRSLALEEEGRFEDGLWCAEEENAFLLANDWPDKHRFDRHFYPLTANGDALFPEAHWASLLEGRCFIAKADAANRLCLIDTSRYVPVGHLDEPVLFIGSSPNWGHWMADLLPRLMALEFFPDLQGYKLAFGPLSTGQAECLDLMGVPEKQRLILDLKGEPAGMFSVRRLAVPSAPPLAMAYPWLNEKLAAGRAVSPDDRAKPERVYLSRRGYFPVHRLINQDEVETLFERRGFTILRPERMGVEELIATLSAARIVASPIGAGLGNFLLAPKSAVMIHLVPNYLKDGFERNDLFANWMRYYFPLKDRMIFAYGSFQPPSQEFAGEHELSGIDIPAHFAPDDIDMAILSAEKQETRQGPS